MPRYEYICPKHGSFEEQASFDDGQWPCHCGRASERQAVYREQGVIFKGGGFTKSVLPPPGPDAQQELFKEVKQRYGGEDRAIEELRSNIVEDAEGRKSVDLSKMTKEA